MPAVQSVTCYLAVAAFILCLISALGKCPTWVPLLFLIICELLRCMPK